MTSTEQGTFFSWVNHKICLLLNSCPLTWDGYKGDDNKRTGKKLWEVLPGPGPVLAGILLFSWATRIETYYEHAVRAMKIVS